MKNPNPFLCDRCNAPLATDSMERVMGMLAPINPLGDKARTFNAISLFAWRDDIADTDSIKHFCGTTCASKWGTMILDEWATRAQKT